MNQTPSVLGGMTAQRARKLPPVMPSAEDAIDLSGEFPTGSTAPTLRESTIDAIEQHLCDHYTRRPGIASLCRAVASSLAAAGAPLDENLVTICGGVAEARYVAVRALAAGRTVYLPLPAPTVYQAGLAFAGAQVTTFDAQGELPAAQGGLLIISNPNPVTGQVTAPATLERLAAWAAGADLLVIADESVGPVRPDAPFVRFAALPNMLERTLTIGSFAEAPGLGAWHVSWVAGGKRVFTPVRDLKQSITICTAAASQYAALAAATEVDAGEIEAEYAERQEAILGLLDRHGIPYLTPDTVAFVVAQVENVRDVVLAARGARVLVGDGDRLGNPGTVRIAVPSGSLADALEALDVALLDARG
jgi:aspartate/methionine/tyrosine aminotransferase